MQAGGPRDRPPSQGVAAVAKETMVCSFTGGNPGQTEPMCSLLGKNWWAIALRGAVAVLFGLVALIMPGAVMLSLALLFGAYLLVDGVLGIIAAVRAARSHERWAWLLVEGVLNVVVGVLALVFPAG